MPFPWQIATSSAAGALITLFGVLVGTFLSGRAHRRHWSQDKQLAACADIVTESTSVQLAMRRRWRHGDDFDWTNWNHALTLISLVGHPEVVKAAVQIDKTFWRVSLRIRTREIADEPKWAVARDLMEADRLNFVNMARLHVMRTKTGVPGIPIGRIPLAEMPAATRPEPPEQAGTLTADHDATEPAQR